MELWQLEIPSLVMVLTALLLDYLTPLRTDPVDEVRREITYGTISLQDNHDRARNWVVREAEKSACDCVVG